MTFKTLPAENNQQATFKPFLPERRAEIWAIGGGKGGIGKSLVSSGLALTLSKQDKKVLLFDADLGGANLHTLLGIPNPTYSLSDFVGRRVQTLGEVAVSGGQQNLTLISGAGDSLEAANLKYQQKLRLMNRLRTFAGDVLILDLGAGTHYNTLDFFNMAHVNVLVVLPEPTSVENGYRFLRAALLRRLRHVSDHPRYQELLGSAQAMQSDATLRHIRGIAERAADIDPRCGEAVLKVAARYQPRLVLNQVRAEEDMKVGHGLRSACLRMLGIEVKFQGAIPYDDTVWQAVRKRTPHVLAFPDSAAARSMKRLVARLHNEQQFTMKL